jgi:hypothetical protein
MPKSNLNLIKTTFRVPHHEWEAFKLLAEEHGTCPADHLRSLIHEAVKDVRLPGEALTEADVEAVFPDWGKWKRAVEESGAKHSLPELIRLGMNKHLEDYLS